MKNLWILIFILVSLVFVGIAAEKQGVVEKVKKYVIDEKMVKFLDSCSEVRGAMIEQFDEVNQKWGRAIFVVGYTDNEGIANDLALSMGNGAKVQFRVVMKSWVVCGEASAGDQKASN